MDDVFRKPWAARLLWAVLFSQIVLAVGCERLKAAPTPSGDQAGKTSLASDSHLPADPKEVGNLYLRLIDRSLQSNWKREMLRLNKSLENKTAPSRFALFFFSAAAYRAGVTEGGPLSPERRAELQSGAKAALQAFVQAIRTDRTAMADQLLFSVDTVCRLFTFLDEQSLLTSGEREAALDAIGKGADAALNLKYERGAFNRPFHLAAGLAAARHLLSDHPNAPAWQAYMENVWNDFTTPGDTFEDCSGYNGLWSITCIELASALGCDLSAYEHIWDRMAAWISPNGSLPDFGNESYFYHGAASWIAAWEKLGAHFQRRDFQDHAARIASALDRAEQFTDYELDPLILAHKAVSVRVSPRPPRSPAEITTRRTEWGGTVPDKLVLRSSTGDGKPTFVCVDLHDFGYHGHADAGAISLITSGDQVLIHELGREAIEVKDHFSAWASPDSSTFFVPGKAFPDKTFVDWLINHKWPGTYMGSYTPNLHKVTSLFFRLQDVPDLGDQTVAMEVEGVWGILPDGTETRVAGPSVGQITLYANQSKERAFVSLGKLATTDLVPFERLRVRWKADDTRAVVQLGINGASLNTNPTSPEGSLRARGAQPVINAWTGADASGGFQRLMTDSIGRIIDHTRTLKLDGETLTVEDRFAPRQPGHYSIGPLFHGHSLTLLGDRSIKIDAGVRQRNLLLPSTPLEVSFSSPGPLQLLQCKWPTPSGMNEHMAAILDQDFAPGDSVTVTSILRSSPTYSSAVK